MLAVHAQWGWADWVGKQILEFKKKKKEEENRGGKPDDMVGFAPVQIHGFVD